MLKTLNGIISENIGSVRLRAVSSMKKLHAFRDSVIASPPILHAERSNYSAIDELLERPRAFVTDLNGVTYVNSKLLSVVYGVPINDLRKVIRRMKLPNDFHNNIINNLDGSFNLTALGVIEVSKYIEGDLSSEVTLAFIRALMLEDNIEDDSAKILNESIYRREARDYAANIFQSWISQAEKAGISVDELNQADIDKFTDGLLCESLTRFKVQIGFNQHLEAKVSFIQS